MDHYDDMSIKGVSGSVSDRLHPNEAELVSGTTALFPVAAEFEQQEPPREGGALGFGPSWL